MRYALCFVALAGVATAAPDQDEDTEGEVKKDRSARVCLTLIGKGREITGRGHLAKLPVAEVITAGRKILTESKEPAELIGAAIYLGTPEIRKQIGDDLAGAVRKRWTDHDTKLKALGEQLVEAREAARIGKRTLSADKLAPITKRVGELERELEQLGRRWEALTVALGAIGSGSDWSRLDWLIRRGTVQQARASARALCACYDPSGGYHPLLRSAKRVLEKAAAERAKEVQEGKPRPTRWQAQAQAIVAEIRNHIRRSPRASELVRVITSSERPSEVLETLLAARTKPERAVIGRAARGYAESDEASVRAVGLRLLARARDEEALDHMITGLSDEDAGVRIAAAESFSRLGRRRVRDSLVKLVPLLSDSSTKVQKAAHRSLVAMTGKRIALSKSAWLSYFARQRAGE